MISVLAHVSIVPAWRAELPIRGLAVGVQVTELGDLPQHRQSINRPVEIFILKVAASERSPRGDHY